MKKNIISRMKSKKARLAAGVLAVILGMFPTAAQAQYTPNEQSRSIQWISGSATNPLYNLASPGPPNREDNPTGWYGVMSLEDVRLFPNRLGLYYVTSGLFESNGGNGYRINQNYNDEAAAIPAFTMRSGHYVSDAEGSNPYTTQIRLLNNNGGSLIVSPWVGHTGENNTTRNSYRAMLHYGAASTLTFINYNTTWQDFNGSVMYITAGDYHLKAETNASLLASGSRVFTLNSSNRWATGNLSGDTYVRGTSWIYFDNNYGTNGGAIYVAEASLELERVIFGYRNDENLTATRYDTRITRSQGNHATDRGGSIYNGGDLSLSSITFQNGTAMGTGFDSGGGALYNTTQGVVTSGGITSGYYGNMAVYRGGAVYNQGTYTLSAQYEFNTSQFGGAFFNEGTANLNGSNDGAMEFLNNWVTDTVGRGGAIYNDSSGITNINNVRLENNTAIGGYGGAIYNQNVLRLTNIDFHTNMAHRGGAIYNDATGTTTATSGVSFDRNEVTEHGGAIYNTLGTVSLSGTTLTYNTALDGLGGAIYTFRGTFNFNNTELSNNRAMAGGAIYNDRGTLNITRGTFGTNWAEVENGGAIYNDGTINITGRTRFDGNRANSGVGGAIYNGKLAEINLTGNDYSSFSTNIAREGGAIYNDEGGRLNIDGGSSRVTFSHNKASDGEGGAIYNALDGVLDLGNVWFTDNEATGHGGGIYSGVRGQLEITDGQFSGNVAGEDGGAIYNGENGVLAITNIVFDLNVAAGDGGAIYNAQNAVLTLTDVDFSKNTAGGLGGAIYNDGATINVSVDTKTSSFGDGTAGSDTIYFAGIGNKFNVDVANHIDDENIRTQLVMYGAMESEAGSTVDIEKTGVGTWEYRTSSTFKGDETNFTVSNGTLHLFTGAALDLDGSGDSTASTLTLANPDGISLKSGLSFDGTASLIIQEGCVVKTDTLVAKTGSSIVSGIVTLYMDPSFTVNTATAFTLDRTSAATATINADTFKIDGDTTIIASAFTFKSGTDLIFSDATRYASTGDGPILTLRPSASGVGVVMESDIYVRAPQEFIANQAGYIIVAEVTNNGYFNANNNTPTTGKFWVYDSQSGTYKEGSMTPFVRTLNDADYEGLTATSNADNTGSWIIYAMANSGAASDDLMWTGVDPTNNTYWDQLDSTNWSGTVLGIPVDVFKNGDTVIFGDTYGADSIVGSKTVDLMLNIAVKSMTVTGEEYTFNLNGKNITGEEGVDFGTTTTINIDRSLEPRTASSTITAASIVLDTGSAQFKEYGLHFATKEAEANDVYLSLGLTEGGVIDVASDIYVKTPDAVLGGEVILIEAKAGTTLERTGNFYVDENEPLPFVRSEAPGTEFLGIKTNDDQTAIVLYMANTSDNTDLIWTGITSSTWAHNTTVAQNWYGEVAGIPVYTFLNGDNVTFDETAENKRVTLSGDVEVGTMAVTTTGYTFDLAGGGITGTGEVNFGASKIENGTGLKDSVLDRTIEAPTIVFDGGNDFTFNVKDVTNGQKLLILDGSVQVDNGMLGSGIIDIYGTVSITNGESIILIDADFAGNENVITDAGTLYQNGEPSSVDRTSDMLGLATNDTKTQLLLTVVKGGANTELHWSGLVTAGVGRSAWDDNVSANWAGLVGGNYVDKFLNGDVVIFGETYTDKNRVVRTVTNRAVNVATGGVEVGEMTVETGADGYVFDLSAGGITAVKNSLANSTGSIHFGSADVKGVSGTETIKAAGDITFGSGTISGISGTDVIKAAGDITFGGGTLEFGGVATISAGNTGTIDFTSSTLGTVAGKIVAGTTFTAGTIEFAGGNNFTFDLNGVGNGQTVLTLTAGTVNGTIGNGIVDIYGANLGVGETITLITGGSNVVAGTLWVDGSEQQIDRNSDRPLYGLDVVNSDLILKVIDISGNVTLVWTGVVDGAANSTWNTTTKNWFGNISGNKGETTFKTDDIVEFNNTYDGNTVMNRLVNVVAGGVRVGNMTVEAGAEGYVFDLSVGGIQAVKGSMAGANGNINFGSADIKGIRDVDGAKAIDAAGNITFGDGTLEFADTATINSGGNISFAATNFGSSEDTAILAGTTVSAVGTINVGGGNGFHFDVTGVDAGGTILTLTAANITGTIGDGRIDVWGTVGITGDETIILVDTNAGNAVNGIGTLYVNDQEQIFVRGSDDPIYGLDTTSTTQLILKVLQGDDPSSNLVWTGAIDGNWDVNVTKNWKGDVGGHFVDTFMNKDNVIFDDTASTINRTVAVTPGGVTVGNMNVNGSGYTFNLTNGGITAQVVRDAAGNVTGNGNIDFGSANLENLSDKSKIYAEGNIDFAGGGIIDMTLGSNILIEAKGDIDLDRDSQKTTLNIVGFKSTFNDPPIVVIRAGGTLTNAEEGNLVVTIGSETEVDYATASVIKEGNDVKVGMQLSWFFDDKTKAHGNFTINSIDEKGILIIDDLYDIAGVNPADNEAGWDGTWLTKKGAGTLTLAGNNSYTGDTKVDNGTLVLTGNNTTTGTAVIGDSGTLVIQNANAVGSGPAVITGTGTLKVVYDGEYRQTITSTTAGNVIFGSVKDKLVLKTDNAGHLGKTTIESGTVRLESFSAAGQNSLDREIHIAAKDATLELVGVDGLNPCDSANDTKLAGAEFKKQITGLGNVTVDGGLVVLTNSGNSYQGATTVNGNSGMIVDNAGALGDTSGIEVRGSGVNAGTFTVGFGGNFTKSISGTGNVYVNPGRTGANTTTFSVANTYTGSTIVCDGATLKLEHIMGTGENYRGTASTVELRNNSTLQFAVGGDYYKEIVDIDGTGSVVKTTGSKLSLWNTNTYGGGTTISGGELVARNAGAVGSGDVTLAGGTFSVLVDAENDGNRFGNEIIGEGNVNFGTTAGTLILESENGYFGYTTITQGTVKLTDLGATGANNEDYTVQIGDGVNAEAATLILGVAGAYNKTISGSGTLIVDVGSDNTLTLTGTNSNFTGTAHLKRGTTELGNIAALGGDRSQIVMENRTTLLFGNDVEGTLGSGFSLVSGNTYIDTEGNVTLTGLIDGEAVLNKIGSGTLKLSNANNSFAGLNIKGGRIMAENQDALGNGTILNEAQLELFVDKGRTVTLRSGIDSKDGTFIKSGLGTLDMGTKYAPFVADRFVMNGGSLEIQLSQEHYVQAEFVQTKGQSSELIGTYNSTDGLSRGSDRAERFLALDGVGSNDFTTYTFNTSIDRVNGQKFFDAAENKLYFELWLDSFLDAYGKGLSYNARQVADAVDRLPSDNPLLNILSAFENDGGNMREAFSSLHGEVYMSSVYATADLQRNFNELLLNRRINCEHCGEFKAFRGQQANMVQREVWATFTGGGNFRTKFDRFSGYNIGRWGVATGMEHQFSQNVFTGVALGYDQADLDMKDLSQKDQFYAFRAAAYGNVTVDDVSVFGQFGYSKNWHDVERRIDFMGERAKGKYNDDVITVGADVAKTYHVGNVNIIPSIGFNYVNLRSPFIEETGGGEAALFVHKKRYESFRVPMGVRTNSKFNIQNVDFMPEFRLFFVPEFGDTQVRGVTAFASDAGNSFIVNSGVRGSACLRVGLGMQAQLFDFLSIGVDYDAEVWGKFTRHDVGGNVRLRW